MEQIISKVLEAEQQAEQALGEARRKAAAIRAAADAESATRVQEARAKAKALSQETLAAARAEAEAARERAVAQAAGQAELFLQENQATLRRLVDQVVTLITTTGLPKG